MDLNRAIIDRHAYLSDACSMFRDAWKKGRLSMDRHGNVRWREKKEEERWALLHRLADECIKRYFERKGEPW